MWRLDGAVQFTFPAGVIMDPWSYVVMVGFDPGHDPVMLDWFRGRYGVATNVPIFGPWEGHLDNAGERVALYMPDKPEIPPSQIAGFVPQVLVEEVHYSPLPPWPPEADGTGNSLQRIASAAFADDPANWQAGAPTVGQLNQGAMSADTDHDGLPDEWELANGLDPNDPNGANGALDDPDGDGMDNLQEFLAGTDPHNAADALRFDGISVTDQACLLRFNAHSGRNYTVERLSVLGDTNMWEVITNLVPSTDGPLTVVDPQAGASQYYRLKVTRN